MAMKKNPKNTTIALLRTVNTFLMSLQPNDVDGLLSGRLELSINPRKPTPSLKSGQTNTVDNESDYQTIIDMLGQAENIKSGTDILQGYKLTKVGLEKIARLIDAPVQRQDTVSRLQEKIIEALVGSRLNSNAIIGDK